MLQRCGIGHVAVEEIALMAGACSQVLKIMVRVIEG